MPKTTKENAKKESEIKKKKTSSKQTPTMKSSIKKTTKKTSKVVNSNSVKKQAKIAKNNSSISVMEYYDLPYRYNQTLVKILAQTPNMLFVYWDISDEDKKLFLNKYGNDFFNTTKPILFVHNKTNHQSFEIEINDFANSWYLQVNDTNCKYQIELGRRPYTYVEFPVKKDYIYITSSNEINAPNDHILFEKFNPNVTYQNIKSGKSSTKNFSNLSNYNNMKQIYHIYDLYKDIYKNELFEEILHNDLNNPSS